MTRQRPFAAPATAFLLVLLSACAADSTGPGDDEPEVVSDRIVVRISHMEVVHDCDPALDNPGDFQAWVEIYQDTDPTPGQEDYRLVASSPKRTVSLNSGESSSRDDIRVEGLVQRVRARPVRVRGVFRELDNGLVDAGSDLVATLRWWDERNCWQLGDGCMITIGANEYNQVWTHHIDARQDEFNLFNPDDEGCEFYVNYGAHISES
jgi:hypothetical protein